MNYKTVNPSMFKVNVTDEDCIAFAAMQDFNTESL